VVVIAILALLYVPGDLAEVEQQHIAEQSRAMAGLMARALEPSLASGDSARLQAEFSRVAPASGLLGARMIGADGKVHAQWLPTKGTAWGDLADDVQRVSASVPMGGTDRGVTLEVVHDLSRAVAEYDEHISVAHLAIFTLLAIGLVISWFAAVFSLRRQRAEEALSKSKTNIFELLDGLPDAVVIHREGRILYANPVFANIAERPAAAVVGRSYLDYVHGDDRAVVIAEADALLRGEAPADASEYRFEAPSGKKVIAQATSVGIQFDKATAVATIARDVTRDKKLQAQLAFADRMMSVGTLAAGLAHEVNNPLTFVIGNLDLMSKETRRKAKDLAGIGLDDLPEIVDDAIEGAQRVRRIVGDLKTFSSTSGDQKAPLDVADLIDASVKMAFAEINHRAVIERNYAEVQPVLGNEPSLCQVFLNLIVNAARAVEAAEGEDKTIHIVIKTDAKGRVVVEVRDAGIGIPPENIPRLFDPFFTTRPVGEGTGLGLSVCHNIIDEHGGAIEVESEVGTGTVFRVKLPVASTEARRKRQVFAATGRFTGIHLLVIDDEVAVGTLFKRIMAPRHQVVTMDSSRQGLDALLDGGEFDLIFCDIMMPDLDGIDVYEQAIAQRPELAERFVFITGGAFTSRAEEFLAQTDRPVMRKPFTPADLKGLVADMRNDVTLS